MKNATTGTVTIKARDVMEGMLVVCPDGEVRRVDWSMGDWGPSGGARGRHYREICMERGDYTIKVHGSSNIEIAVA